MKMKILVVGAGGLAREFSAFFSDTLDVVGFSTAHQLMSSKDDIAERCYPADVTPDQVGTRNCVIAIGDPALKHKLSADLENRGFTFPNIAHESAVLASQLPSTPSGIIISPQCTVGPAVRFGKHVYLNFMVGVGHDATLKNYIQVNPGAQVGGGVVVGEQVLVGSGAVLRHEVEIGDRSRIGSGAVVLGKIKPEVTVIPASSKKLRFPERS